MYYLKERGTMRISDTIPVRRLMPNIAVAIGFTLLSASMAFATNIVSNGDFTFGNTGFTSGYSFVAYAAGNCFPEAVYTIGASPQVCHPSWPSSYGAPPGASAETMIVNGATLAGVTVWSESLTVLPNTQYYFSAWVASNYANPAVLSFSINGIPVGGNQVASSTLGLWTQIYIPWNSGASTTALASILNQNTVASGNDFSLDLLSFDTVAPVPEPATLLMVGGALFGLCLLQQHRRKGDNSRSTPTRAV